MKRNFNSNPGKQKKDLKKLLNLSYLHYTNKTSAAGKHDLPALVCNTSVYPDYIALYNHPGDYHHTRRTAVAFYLYDRDFDGQHGLYNSIYYDNKKDLAKFKKTLRGCKVFHHARLLPTRRY